MIKTYVQNSFFLSEHEAVKDFARLFGCHRGAEKRFFAVCERKEDIEPVREQIALLLEQEWGECSVIGGISVLTLDGFVKQIAMSLSEGSFAESLKRPYLSIVEQETLTSFFLRALGYHGADVLPLSKQILVFADVTWSSPFSFLNLLKEILQTETIEEKTLRQILACYDAVCHFKKSYLTLQEFIKERFLEKEKMIAQSFLSIFLSSEILWICAPEFVTPLGTKKIGNFQSCWVNELLEEVKKLYVQRESSHQEQKTSFYISKTEIPLREVGEGRFSLRLAPSPRALFEEIEKVVKEKDCLLADLNLEKIRKVMSWNAAGLYPIKEHDIEDFFREREGSVNTKEENISFSKKKVSEKIEQKFENFVGTVSLFYPFEDYQEIAQTYGLSFNCEEQSLQSVFAEHMSSEECLITETPFRLLKELFFIVGIKKLDNIIVLGRPHTSTLASFPVRLLNHMMIALIKRGIPLDLSANEMMYRGFWTALLEDCKAEFWLFSSGDREKFPDYLKGKEKGISLLALDFQQGAYKTSLDFSSLFIPSWQKDFQINSISITQFEEYLVCPLRFYLSHLLKLEKEEDEKLLEYDLREVGKALHKLTEEVLNRLCVVFGNRDYEKIKYFLLKIENIFSDEKLFFAPCFNQALKEALEALLEEKQELYSDFEKVHLQALFDEIIKVFSSLEKDEFPSFYNLELVKRVFLRFLRTEMVLLSQVDSEDYKVALYTEFPIKLKIGPISLTGRIDRVDSSSKGLRVFDYKVSKTLKKDSHTIALSPKEAKIKNSFFSAQGALYSIGLSMACQEDVVSSFSLYRLRGLDPDSVSLVQRSFSPSLSFEGEECQNLMNEFLPYAERLFAGDFKPNPLDSCSFCPYQTLCPVGRASL